MKKLLFIPAFLIVTALVSSCSKDDDNNTTEPGPLFIEVKSVIASSCAVSGCHTSSGNAGGLNLENNDNIVAAATRINVRAVVEGTMPPTAPLSASDKAKITNWINAGGKLTN